MTGRDSTKLKIKKPTVKKTQEKKPEESPAEAQKRDWHGLDDESDDAGNDSADDSDDNDARSRVRTKRRKLDISAAVAGSDSEDDDAASVDEEPSKPSFESASDDEDTPADGIITTSSKLKALTPVQLAKSKAATAKTGVVYLSRIPPFMKPMKVKDLLSKFGEVGRLFLAPEDPKAHAKRVKYGGNKKKNFVEGWVEFKNKKDAKLCAETLNAQIVGGKKGNFYHDDVWNIKYLPKFKWHHLQAQISYENASRQAKMRAEIAKETKVNKTILKNYERAKMVSTMQESKKRKLEESGDAAAGGISAQTVEVRRQFRQNKVKGAMVEPIIGNKAERVKNIASSVF